MATIKVSNSSQLTSALRSAGSGDKIVLSGGSYEISARNQDYHGATITAAAGANVSVTQVTFNNVSNLTFDGIDFVDRAGNDDKLFVMASSSDVTIRNSSFDGRGSGVAFWVNKSDGITISNTDVSDFKTGFWIGSTKDLTVQNNDLTGIRLDGMIIGKVHDTVISGNDISLKVPSGSAHTDGIQFYNTGANDPMSNVVVRDNYIATNNSMSHGIYAANGLADGGGGTSTFFRNITIDHNTVVSGQLSGIAIGQTIGLKITNNTVLQNSSTNSSREIAVPVIRVQHDSQNVTITGNTTHEQPAPSGKDWQATGKAESGWTISGNKIVKLGTKASTSAAAATLETSAASGEDSSSATATKVASAESATATATKASASADALDLSGNGQADTFRFDAKGAADKVGGLDFGEGDRIVLHDYALGTFHDQAGGNPLAVSANGSQVLIDSWADLRELDQASSAVTVREGKNDTLIIDIGQSGTDHVVKILDAAHAYF